MLDSWEIIAIGIGALGILFWSIVSTRKNAIVRKEVLAELSAHSKLDARILQQGLRQKGYSIGPIRFYLIMARLEEEGYVRVQRKLERVDPHVFSYSYYLTESGRKHVAHAQS